MPEQLHTINLYLRAHTAQLVRAWSGTDEHGRSTISRSKQLGAVIYANIIQVDAPVDEDYEYSHEVPVLLKVRQEPGSHDWRKNLSHITRANMGRIDGWIHSVFVTAIFYHWDGGGRQNKNASIRTLMERYGLTEEHVEIDSLRMAVRRMVWDEQNTGITRPPGLGLKKKKHYKKPRFCSKVDKEADN